MQLGLVGEHQVDRALLHQIDKFVAIAIDAERIRQGQRDLAAGVVRDLRGLHEGLLGVLRIPEIAFEIDDLRACDIGRIDIAGHEVLRRAEIGVHGALAILRHQDVGAAGGRPLRGRPGFERDAGGADIVGVHPPDLVVLDLSDIGRARPQARNPDDGIGGRATRHLGRRAHVAVDRSRPRLVDQRHAALGHAVAGEEAFVGLNQHVENRVTDAENVVFCVSHLIQIPQRSLRKAAAYHTPCGIRSLNDPLHPHGIPGNAGLAPARLCARFDDRGAARHRRGRGRLPGRIPTGQCRAAAVERGCAERGAGADLAAPARHRGRARRKRLRRAGARNDQRGHDRGGGAARLGDAICHHGAGARIRRARDLADRRRRCAIDVALSGFRRPGHGDAGTGERAIALRADRVFAGPVQHRANCRDDRIDPDAARCRLCRAGAGCNHRPGRLAAIADPDRASARRRGRCAASRLAGPRDAPLSWPRAARHGRERGAAIADRRRRGDRIGVAMGTVLIPELTRSLRGGDKDVIAHAESRALELAIGLALPATLGLIALSEPIVRLLFEHGAFTAGDTAATAQALVFLALGLPAQVLVKALSPAFFAREDTLAPLWATLKAVVVAIVCAILLGHFFGAAGIAAGIALGAWSNALSLIRQGAASFGFSVDQAARRRLPRIVAAALIMGGALWLATSVAAAPTHGIAQAVILLLLIAGGIAAYALFLAL